VITTLATGLSVSFAFVNAMTFAGKIYIKEHS
jgi:hypothetical protein